MIYKKNLRIRISTICLIIRRGDTILISTGVAHSVTLHFSNECSVTEWITLINGMGYAHQEMQCNGIGYARAYEDEAILTQQKG